MLKLIRVFPRAEFMEKKVFSSVDAGMSQGGTLYSLPSNIVLGESSRARNWGGIFSDYVDNSDI